MEQVVVLGSTGSVGKSTLSILAENSDRFRVQALVAHRNATEMIGQALQFRPSMVVMTDSQAAERVRCGLSGTSVRVHSGTEILDGLVTSPMVGRVIVATSGLVGLRPTLRALEAGKRVAIANKEILVVAGHLVGQAGGSLHTGTLLPIDSEHVALLQCVQGEQWSSIQRMVLTASGGALRDLPTDQWSQATPQQVLQHPNWSMGAVITVNTATMMNKGFEIMEAHWLFGLGYDRLDAVLHPQSIVHGLVSFCDGTWLAQLGPPDMRSAVLYALTCPERVPISLQPLDWTNLELSFCTLDPARYPCFSLALEAGRRGGTFPAVLYSANTVMVETFLQGKCPFSYIWEGVNEALQRHIVQEDPSLEALEEINREVRFQTLSWCQARL
ncbi:1-deoxy-D-xylulose-5-phosphate reductoisomerase [Pasteuria penetrans]|uniref:1-deoxy-D-xylulose-5-phosphate reductoisomerase n=1 Tax=Pasteuria penetrans TaxID=86005 RepID=UPI000F9F65F6|nr:1-deoxy-D-xylulose-5-phosphate reductoisomerase [Pasteuria penetrans]